MFQNPFVDYPFDDVKMVMNFFQPCCKKILLTFALLKLTKNIWRKVTALILLFVFLSIHVVKAMHTHTVAFATNLSVDDERVEKMTDCNICDYHLSKEAANVSIYVQNERIIPVTSAIPFYKTHIPTSIGLSYADRGPPAIA